MYGHPCVHDVAYGLLPAVRQNSRAWCHVEAEDRSIGCDRKGLQITHATRCGNDEFVALRGNGSVDSFESAGLDLLDAAVYSIGRMTNRSLGVSGMRISLAFSIPIPSYLSR